MISLTHFNNKSFYLNAELIRSVEATPDTLITLRDDSKLLVRESVEQVIGRVIEYQRMIHMPLDLSQPQG